MQKSVYIIKPEAMRYGKVIHSLIEKAGLRVVASMITILPENAIDALYPGIEPDLRAATLHYLSVGPCEIGVVEGRDAIRCLSELAGGSVNPAECDAASIRGRFGAREARRFLNAAYFLNGFHRSRDLSEVEKDLALFRALEASHKPKFQ